MQRSSGEITYCTNVLPGISWPEHFFHLQKAVPAIKAAVSPNKPLAIGLRLANEASMVLQQPAERAVFKKWLQEHDCYVPLMNGFPYGSFHETVVKDQVHAPDWLTAERVEYTIRLAEILADLLPADMEGGISTSPLSYRFWHAAESRKAVLEKTTLNLLKVVERLVRLKQETSRVIHIDLEPEPDGLIENGTEFLEWYTGYLLPLGTSFLADKLGCDDKQAAEWIKAHVHICYDICHFAVNYEDHAAMIKRLQELGIKIGRVQVSAALKALLPEAAGQRKDILDAFRTFNEDVYLHQVVALKKNGAQHKYPDLPEALSEAPDADVVEWRSHFHVPVFIENYGLLQSTQRDILEVLLLHKQENLTRWLEVETYTWAVLPGDLQLPLNDSMIRELQWLQQVLNN